MIKDLLKIKTTNRSEYYYLLFLALVWGYQTANFGLVFLTKIVGGSPLTFLIPTFEVIFALASLKYWKSKLRLYDFVFLTLCVMIYALSPLITPETEDYISDHIQYFFIALTYYLIGRTIDVKKAGNLLYRLSILNILLSSFYYIVFTKSLGRVDDDIDHIMVAAYNLLPSVIFVTWRLISDFDIRKTQTFLNIIVTVIGVLLISSFGTRGVLVCYVTFVVLYVLLFAKIKHSKIIKTITLLIVIFIFNFFDIIVLFMAGFTESIGMSSRIFTTLMDGTFMSGEASTNERDYLLSVIKNAIDSDPTILGMGHGFYGWAKYIYVYPHNYYYEMILSFGYITAYSLMLALAYLIIKSLRNTVDDAERAFIILLICCGFVKLFMSGSFVDEYLYYFMIGYIVSIAFRPKYKN